MEITPELRKEIYDLLGDTASVFTISIAKLYVNDGKNTDWTDTGLAGVLCFILDRVLCGYLLRMYEPNTKDLLFEFELHYEFTKTYDSYGKFFHIFPIPGGVLGVYIPDLDKSEEFKEVITYFAPKEKTEVPKEDKKKHKNKIVNPIGNFMMGLRNKKQEKVQDFTMSKPYSVKLVSSVEWDSKTQCFNLDRVSKELKNVMKGMGMGIRKLDLKNKETAIKVIRALSQASISMNPPEDYIDEDSYENSQSSQSDQSINSENSESDNESSATSDEENAQFKSNRSRSISQYNTQQYLLDIIAHPPEPKKSQESGSRALRRRSAIKVELRDHLVKEMQKRRAEISKYDLKSEQSESDMISEYSEST